MKGPKALFDALFSGPGRVAFGLAQQGHMPTIKSMLADGKGWDEIGRAIGWCGDAAKDDYYRRLCRDMSDSELMAFAGDVEPGGDEHHTAIMEIASRGLTEQ